MQRQTISELLGLLRQHLASALPNSKHLEATGTIFLNWFNDILADDTLDLVVVVTPAPHTTSPANCFWLVKCDCGQADGWNDNPGARTSWYRSRTQLILHAFQNRRFDGDF